jgi:hypothetical protein
MRIKTRRLVYVLLLLLGFAHASRVPAAPPHGTEADLKPNGITVGRPKVFDNRTLVLMLEGLSESLRNLQFVDQKSLAAAFNLLQGFQSSETVSNLTLTALPTSGLKQENVTTTGNATAAGAPLPNTGKQTTTTSRDAFTPQPPTLDSPPAFSGFNPSYGENPSDLLGDQVNLTYQIFNLRMLLERSLSDRLLTDGQPRLQAVLGFNVTIDPPRTAADAVAVVEITLSSGAGAQPDGLSLVSLMPQEKTYNAAALSTKSNAFGGAAVAKMFQVAYGRRQRSQTFYLYRDTDTVSYERMSSDHPGQIVFGWMFRPVLGRRSVSPGLRQMFAIVALPAADQKGSSPPLLQAAVRTYWKRYDRNTMTAFEDHDANRATRFGYGLSLNLSKPEIFESRYLNFAHYEGIEVKTTDRFQERLGPRVDKVSWRTAGEKTAVITVEGDNLFSGTQVALGDKLYSTPADGLLLNSNQSFELTTTLSALASHGTVIGRYGPAVSLGSPKSVQGPPGGVRIQEADYRPAGAGNGLLEIHLRPRAPVQDGGWGATVPIVMVNGSLLPLPYEFRAEDNGMAVLTANVPDSPILEQGGVIKVTYPFLPDPWTATFLIPNPASAFRVTRLTGKSIAIEAANELGFTMNPADPGSPAGPDFCWQLLAGEQVLPLRTTACPNGASQTRALSGHAVKVTLDTDFPDKIALLAPPPTRGFYRVDVPKLAAPPAAPPQPLALHQYDAVWVTVEAKDPSRVAFVEADQLRLRWRPLPPDKPAKPAKALQIEVTRRLTAKPGDVDVSLLDQQRKLLGGVRIHIAPQHDEEKGEE